MVLCRRGNILFNKVHKIPYFAFDVAFYNVFYHASYNMVYLILVNYKNSPQNLACALRHGALYGMENTVLRDEEIPHDLQTQPVSVARNWHDQDGLITAFAIVEDMQV